MSWSFLLAIRLRPLEPLFGGLDAMYKVHRWIGVAAVAGMFLHVQIEPEIEGGIRGASESVADSAENLAGTGETMLYILVALSVIRWMPYRYWRWTHKLIGVPFSFACWHFFTAEKPYANSSAWGYWFGFVMLVGLASWLVRVIGRDMVARGKCYRVTQADRVGTAIELELEPVSQPLTHRAGEFAVVKLEVPGMREPHVFSIGSSPGAAKLRFFIRDLGDWTHRLQSKELVGASARVEGPYGKFSPLGAPEQKIVWIAGGVGITPFLSAIAALPTATPGLRPTLFYAVRSKSDAMALDELEAAHAQGRIELVLRVSSENARLGSDSLADHFGSNGLVGAHVAVCGPAGLIRLVQTAAERAGASHVETEDFDIRGGIGPDLSASIEQALGRL